MVAIAASQSDNSGENKLFPLTPEQVRDMFTRFDELIENDETADDSKPVDLSLIHI